jgi:hypothetical protein
MTKHDERAQAAALGEEPLAMFEDGLPLKFLRGSQRGVSTVEFSSKREDEWQRKEICRRRALHSDVSFVGLLAIR